MRLDRREKKIVNEFKRRIENEFLQEIVEVIVFGSKARGDAVKNSDIDLLVVTVSDDWEKGDKIRDIGYDLDEGIDYKLSIQVMSKAHVEYLKKNNFQFIANVEKEGISI
jgi:predicted nucleotidyltransferase